MTTTHLSAGLRRRRRLRRTLLLATLLLVAGVALRYAGWPGEEPASTDASAHHAAPAAGGVVAAKPNPAAAATTGTKPQKSSSASGFAPVVTDRIPQPSVSLALTAPVPGLTNMQPAAANAFNRAFADARRGEGLAFEIRSAWRSAQWQQVLFDRAVKLYGSPEEAAKWVLPPERSAHVKGYAVDVHPQAFAAWLEVHGPAYGICRTYDNEWWHFEYLATSTCPPRTPTAAG